MTEAYPLQWPAGKPRTRSPQDARFGSTTVEIARRKLQHELKLLGATLPVVSTNIELRKDGMPYSGRRTPDDRGVAVYFSLKNRPMCFACDKWQKIEHNILALAHTISALRGIERWGGGEMVEQAFSGFTALPAPKGNLTRNWFDVLECRRDSSYEVVRANYQRLARDHHPDNGGSTARMSEINEAWTEFKLIGSAA